MLISYNWLKDYIDIDLPIEQVEEILTNTGLEVEGIEKISASENIPDELVVGYINSVEKHPDADKLTICKVDINTDEYLQIICGASNVAKGQKVAVATVGATLTSNKGEKIKIKKAKLRGVLSQGMICAEDEIGLSDSHDGIMVLDDKLKTGIPFKETLDTKEDAVIEIAITPNRGDAISYLGVARDIAAMLHKKINYPSLKKFSIEEKKYDVEVKIDERELCPRYSGLVISDVKVGESPDWLKEKLNSIGNNPVNNIVDACNFVMFETGQPLHAFDFDIIEDKKIVVKKLEKGTTFITLDDSKVELNGEEIMICDGKKAVAMGGVMGGVNSIVNENTTNIFLESAFFNPTAIRKASKKHAFLTDAAYRFERTTDPNNTVDVLKRVSLLIKEIAGGKISSEIIDNYPQKIEEQEIEISFDFINTVVGNIIPKETVIKILESLEYKIEQKGNEKIKIIVPTYRADVLRDVDIIEEILRIYSYNKIEFNEQVKSVLPNEELSSKLKLGNSISNYLTAKGFFEILTPSFTNSKYLKDEEDGGIQSVTTINAVNTNLATLRNTFVLSGLETISFNKKRGNSDLKFYEFGKTYFKINENYIEEEKLGIWITGSQTKANWYTEEKKTDIYYLKLYVDNILRKAGNTKKIKQKNSKDKNFIYCLEYKADKKKIAKIGLIHPEITKRFDIDFEVFFAEIDYKKLGEIKESKTTKYVKPSKYPSMTRDISMELDKKLTYEEIKNNIYKLNFNILKEINIFDVYEGDNIDKEKKSYAIRMKFQDDKKTLKDEQVDKIVLQIINVLEKEINAIVRK